MATPASSIPWAKSLIESMIPIVLISSVERDISDRLPRFFNFSPNSSSLSSRLASMESDDGSKWHFIVRHITTWRNLDLQSSTWVKPEQKRCKTFIKKTEYHASIHKYTNYPSNDQQRHPSLRVQWNQWFQSPCVEPPTQHRYIWNKVTPKAGWHLSAEKRRNICFGCRNKY